MADIAPILQVTQDIKSYLETGGSVFSFIKVQREINCSEIQMDMNRLSAALISGGDVLKVLENAKSQYRRSLYEIILMGVKGLPILDKLQSLENEIILACDAIVEQRAARLPILCLCPLLFLQFPAIALLVVVPLIKNLMEAL